MSPEEFIAKWRGTTRTERSASQEHFLDLCALLGVPKPADVDRHGTEYTFEKSTRRIGDTQGFADVWRRGRLSCPGRHQLGSFLLGALPADLAGYIRFHLETIGCRYCAANLDDLRQAADAASSETVRRRQKYFQSSAGYVRKPGPKR